MPRNDNYPDDIRMYDNDPRSPFYVDPDEGWLEDAQNKLNDAWLAELAEHGYVEALDWSLADFDAARGAQDLDVFIQVKSADYVEQYRDDFRPYGPGWD
jgi:hypothetical protein